MGLVTKSLHRNSTGKSTLLELPHSSGKPWQVRRKFRRSNFTCHSVSCREEAAMSLAPPSGPKANGSVLARCVPHGLKEFHIIIILQGRKKIDLWLKLASMCLDHSGSCVRPRVIFIYQCHEWAPHQVLLANCPDSRTCIASLNPGGASSQPSSLHFFSQTKRMQH